MTVRSLIRLLNCTRSGPNRGGLPSPTFPTSPPSPRPPDCVQLELVTCSCPTLDSANPRLRVGSNTAQNVNTQIIAPSPDPFEPFRACLVGETSKNAMMKLPPIETRLIRDDLKALENRHPEHELAFDFHALRRSGGTWMISAGAILLKVPTLTRRANMITTPKTNLNSLHDSTRRGIASSSQLENA